MTWPCQHGPPPQAPSDPWQSGWGRQLSFRKPPPGRRPSAHSQLQGRKLPLRLPLRALRRPAPHARAPPGSPAAALWRLRLSRTGSSRALAPRGDPGTTQALLRVGGSYNGAQTPPDSPFFLPKEEAPAAPLLTEQLSKLVSSGQGSRHGPRGLRHHSCSVVGPFAVLFGGETLTRARDTICNDLYIYDARESTFNDWLRGKVGRQENLKSRERGSDGGGRRKN